MKIYTKVGDHGSTSLFGGTRAWKSDDRVHAYGEIDELNSEIGVVRAFLVGEDEYILSLKEDTQLATIQNSLFVLGAELATAPEKKKPDIAQIGEEDTKKLEDWIDEMEAKLPPLKNFILPGGSPAAALLHRARTVCRRAERHIVFLSIGENQVRPEVLVYMNRLSDYLFVMARHVNQLESTEDNFREEEWKTR